MIQKVIDLEQDMSIQPQTQTRQPEIMMENMLKIRLGTSVQFYNHISLKILDYKKVMTENQLHIFPPFILQVVSHDTNVSIYAGINLYLWKDMGEMSGTLGISLAL